MHFTKYLKSLSELKHTKYWFRFFTYSCSPIQPSLSIRLQILKVYLLNMGATTWYIYLHTYIVFWQERIRSFLLTPLHWAFFVNVFGSSIIYCFLFKYITWHLKLMSFPFIRVQKVFMCFYYKVQKTPHQFRLQWNQNTFNSFSNCT